MNTQAIAEVELDILAPKPRLLLWGSKIRCLQDGRVLISQRLAIKEQLQHPAAGEDPVDVRQVLLDFAKGTARWSTVQILGYDLGEVLVGSGGILTDRELCYIIMNDSLDVEDDRAFDSFSQGLRPDPPAGGKPARSTFHAHTELGEPASILGNCGWSECARVIAGGDSARIVSYDEMWCGMVQKLDAHPQSQTRPVGDSLNSSAVATKLWMALSTNSAIANQGR